MHIEGDELLRQSAASYLGAKRALDEALYTEPEANLFSEPISYGLELACGLARIGCRGAKLALLSVEFLRDCRVFGQIPVSLSDLSFMAELTVNRVPIDE